MPAVRELVHLGWGPLAIGDLDHRRLWAPSLRLRSARRYRADTIYCVDLRVRRPNSGRSLSFAILHSLEHFFLAGLRERLPDHFVSVGVMGCRTGFYLVFVNEGQAEVIAGVLLDILRAIGQATVVPYARIDQCGDCKHHNLAGAQNVAMELLASWATWLEPTDP